MYIKGRIVTIRSIEKWDLEFLKDMMNSEEIEKMTVDSHFPISSFQEEQWYVNNVCKLDFHKYVIDIPQSGAVGLICLEEIDWKNRSLLLAIKLMEKKSSMVCIGIDAHLAMLRYVFDELQMYRVSGCVLEYNQASLNMQRLCGYKIEGQKRSAVYREGRYHDLILTGILREEYYQFINKEKYWD